MLGDLPSLNNRRGTADDPVTADFFEASADTWGLDFEDFFGVDIVKKNVSNKIVLYRLVYVGQIAISSKDSNR